MKKILNIVIVILSIYNLISCGDMESVHLEHVDGGERVYIGVPYIVDANPGFKRVQLIWKLNADPKIKETCIYWTDINNIKDSLFVAADRSDTVMRKIIDMSEGVYIFEMRNRSIDGNLSLMKIISGTSLGDTYTSQLKNRTILSQIAEQDSIQIKWASEEGCIGVNFNYVNNKGDEKVLKIDGDDTVTIIKDYALGGEFSYTSSYIPEEGALDTISSSAMSLNFPDYFVLSKKGWDVESVSSEEPAEGAANGGLAMHIIDNKTSTYWQSGWYNGNVPLDHTIIFDMQKNQSISSLELARRIGNNHLKDVSFEISVDNAIWVEAGELSFPENADINSKVLEYSENISGRYLKIIVTGSHADPFANIGEIYLKSNVR